MSRLLTNYHLSFITYHSPMLCLHDLTRPALDRWIAAHDGRPPHAARIWKYLYRERVTDVGAMTDLPRRLREALLTEATLTPVETIVAREADQGATRKFLLRLSDGVAIETVFMMAATCMSQGDQREPGVSRPRRPTLRVGARRRGSFAVPYPIMHSPRRTTVCLSTQAGCAVGCVFCATGQAGFTRQLSTGEIVAQALHVARAADAPLTNVVFMGMGEPLLNYEAVVDAIDILHDSAGCAIGAKQLTLSTIGVPAGIRRLADERRPCSLAVSLHAATQAERERLVPAARHWPLDALVDACRVYTARLDRRIFFEWTLIDGVNDAPEQAQQLASLLDGVPAQVNLIPLNATAGYAGAAASDAALDAFRAVLAAAGIPSSVRRRRGIAITGGCGQLSATLPQVDCAVD